MPPSSLHTMAQQDCWLAPHYCRKRLESPLHLMLVLQVKHRAQRGRDRKLSRSHSKSAPVRAPASQVHALCIAPTHSHWLAKAGLLEAEWARPCDHCTGGTLQRSWVNALAGLSSQQPFRTDRCTGQRLSRSPALWDQSREIMPSSGTFPRPHRQPGSSPSRVLCCVSVLAFLFPQTLLTSGCKSTCNLFPS